MDYEKQHQQSKSKIKAAWQEGDMISLVKEAGKLSFHFLLSKMDPTFSFQTFLSYTGSYFDHFILECCKEEALSYVGGTMVLALQSKDTIALHAKLYFQDEVQKWILKERNGMVETARFTDWDTSRALRQLKKTRQIELEIEPPT